MRDTIAAIAVLAMLVGAGLAWLRLVPAMAGFVPFALGGIVALSVGLVSVVQRIRGRRLGLGGGARLPLPPAEAFARARRAAEAMPAWTITAADPTSGTLEAVATTRLLGFQDDIAIRVRADGDGSRVDVRSKSRDGKGDLGVNAARIRAYVTSLEAPTR